MSLWRSKEAGVALIARASLGFASPAFSVCGGNPRLRWGPYGNRYVDPIASSAPRASLATSASSPGLSGFAAAPRPTTKRPSTGSALVWVVTRMPPATGSASIASSRFRATQRASGSLTKKISFVGAAVRWKPSRLPRSCASIAPSSAARNASVGWIRASDCRGREESCSSAFRSRN